MENVAKIREALRCGRDIPLYVYCDNAWTFWEKNDFVVWDDTNEIVIVYRPNDDPQSMAKLPLNVTVTSYEQIQKMEIRITSEALPEVVEGMSKLSTHTEDQKKAILNGSLIAVEDRFYSSTWNKQKIEAAKNS